MNKKPNLNQGALIDPVINNAGNLRKLIEGQKIGFGDDFVQRQTNPAAAQLQAGFDTQRGLIGEEYASRGLGRSSLAARDVGKAQAQTQRDISSVIAEADLMNRQQGKADLQNQIQSLYGLTDMERTQRNLATGNAQDIAQKQIGLNKELQADQRQGARNLMDFGVGMAGSMLTGNPMMALNSLSSLGVGLGDTAKDSILKNALAGQIAPGLGASTGQVDSTGTARSKGIFQTLGDFVKGNKKPQSKSLGGSLGAF